MMQTREDLRKYLAADAVLYEKVSTGILKRLKNRIFTNPINTQYIIYKYVVLLRHAEYHMYNSMLFESKGLKVMMHTVALAWYYWRLRKVSYKTGFQIPPGVCGPGLQIWHYGSIVINESVRIGANVTLYPGVEIGEKNGGYPSIGDNCFIGAGAKIFGGISVGNNVVVAPNAVVVKDVPDNAIVGGVPARILRYK